MTPTTSATVTIPSYSDADRLVRPWVSTALYFSRVWIAWLALARIAPISLSAYLMLPWYNVMMFRRWEIDTTNFPVCLATRSAVRCRIPVSIEEMDESGISWVLAYRIRLRSSLRIMAPSILASSYK
ncbi:hypothetical protein D3C73_1215940 [compost metagenome]